MFRSNLDIMSPQWTNVIFKDRNQAYGAYQLRRDNSYNTMRALIITAGVFVVALATPTIINIIKGYIPKADPVYHKIDVQLISPPAIEKVQPPPPPVQQRQVRSQHDVVVFPPPVVRPDPETHQEPPTDEILKNADPGQTKLHGDDGAPVNIDDQIGPKDVAGVTEANPAEAGTIFTAVEISPMYPGGDAAFNKFLGSHIRYPNQAKENGTQGRVFVSFVVEIDGSLTDMKIVRDPGSGLGEEAVRVLKTSQRWSPGIQNGKKVRVAYTVPVNFTLAE